MRPIVQNTDLRFESCNSIVRVQQSLSVRPLRAAILVALRIHPILLVCTDVVFANEVRLPKKELHDNGQSSYCHQLREGAFRVYDRVSGRLLKQSERR